MDSKKLLIGARRAEIRRISWRLTVALPQKRPAVERFFLRWHGNISGPFSPLELTERARNGRITKQHYISKNKVHWMPADSAEWLFASQTEAAELEPSSPSQSQNDAPPMLRSKSGVRLAMNSRLQSCPVCGETIAKTAGSCPHCGHAFSRSLEQYDTMSQPPAQGIHIAALVASGVVVIGVFLPFAGFGIIQFSLMQISSMSLPGKQAIWWPALSIITCGGASCVAALRRLTSDHRPAIFYILSAVAGILCLAGLLFSHASAKNQDSFLSVADVGFYMICIGLISLFVIGIIVSGERKAEPQYRSRQSTASAYRRRRG